MKRQTSSRGSAIVLSLLASVLALAAHDSDAQTNAPGIHYTIKGSRLELLSSYDSGPNQRTKSSSQIRLLLKNEMVHDYPKPVFFLALEILGFDEKEKLLRLNPEEQPSGDSDQVPLAVAGDWVLSLVWFDEPFVAGKPREVTLKAPIDYASFKRLRTVDYRTVAVGFGFKDAVPALADPLLSQDMRKEMATRISHALGRRYYYLDDKGRWVLSDEVPELLPVAPGSERALPNVLEEVGSSEKKTEIVIWNRGKEKERVRVAGDGRNRWFWVEPGKQVVAETEAGFLAISALDPSCITRTVRVEDGKRYLFKFGAQSNAGGEK